MFYIKKVGLLGEKGDSSLDLKQGLNIVGGSSNTGKSIIVECIDYALGDKEYNIELDGYDSVYLVLAHEKGDVKITRKLADNRVTIESQNSLVEDGEYPIKKKGGKKKGDRFLDDILLILNDIEPRLDIVVTQDWKKQNFTFRTCLSSFIIKQENIIRRESPFLPLDQNAARAYKPGLLFLWTGERYLNDNDKEGMRMRRARKSAVESYVMELLKRVSAEKEKLQLTASLDPKALEDKIQETLALIEQKEEELTLLFAENKSISAEIINLDDQISECSNLLLKYESLNTQYQADAKRLQLVIEGEVKAEGLDKDMYCPFCNGFLEKSVQESCAEAAAAEMLKLAPKIQDLDDATKSLQDTKAELEVQRDALKSKKQEILEKINYEIKPLISKLKGEIDALKQSIEDAKTAKMLLEQEQLYRDKLESLAVDLESENTKFVVMEKYDGIIDALTTEYNRLLALANYKFTNDATFHDFDFVIDNKHKRSQGQGYRAYLNALAVLALYNCLYRDGVYSMPFLVMDSPIQSLVENDNIDWEHSMKTGLFRCLNECSGGKQIIVIENKFPENLDYRDANVVSFTKDEETGRYGFATGIVN